MNGYMSTECGGIAMEDSVALTELLQLLSQAMGHADDLGLSLVGAQICTALDPLRTAGGFPEATFPCTPDIRASH